MKTLLFFAVLLGGLRGLAQPAGYEISNRNFTIDADGVAHLDEAPNDGIAWIKGRSFSEGTIELDIRGKDAFQRSFVGIAYHGVDDSTFEAVYFRPFNFHSPDPARVVHAVQYVALPEYDWSKLRQGHPGVYEKAATPAPKANDWFHVKIVVDADRVSVFVNGSAVASLEVTPLVHRPGQKIGYWVGNGSAGDFQHLHVTPKK